MLGDSLSAAYGIARDAGWVALLQQRLDAEGYRYRVVNASVSGETTAGGRARLPALLDQHDPAIVLVELGGNDGLRALPLPALRGNLEAVIASARRAGAEPVLFQMHVPPNYGAAYAEGFAAAFADVARAQRAALVPFLLGAIAFDEGAFQDDGIHPTAAAQPKLLEAVWPVLAPLLARRAAASAPTARP